MTENVRPGEICVDDKQFHPYVVQNWKSMVAVLEIIRAKCFEIMIVLFFFTFCWKVLLQIMIENISIIRSFEVWTYTVTCVHKHQNSEC